jgi:hypothetical protein
MLHRCRLAGAAALAALFAPFVPVASAQSVLDSELRLAPQFLQYRLDAPTAATISQFAIPVFISVPVSERLTFDVGTSYASSRVTSGNAVSAVNGLTDTHVRGNLTLGSDFIVLTAGLNLPTGTSSVTLDQFAAAGLIGNDFLAFPISSMGTGLAVTGGVAMARPIGAWNLGIGGAVRRSAAYEPFDIPGQTLRFQPGNEYRVRVGADRPIGAGRVALGLSYSAFGTDDAGGSVYNTGNRLIAQGVYSAALPGRDVTISAYNVFRGPGTYASGAPAGRENIADVLASVGFNSMGPLVEPSIELRHWLQNVPGVTSGTTTMPDRSQSSVLGTVGLRTRVTLGEGVRVFPAVAYTVGSLATNDAAGAPAHAGLTGFRAQLAMRVGR